ncbi:hypothetical protein [Pleionea sediminis]|uniref:hypothetical protein n=1 Tax=Pleionea sediminis TaxID=2569479 RepID=UPI001186D5FA|nr:hypothetical protein [Pleionea sediminis]
MKSFKALGASLTLALASQITLAKANIDLDHLMTKSDLIFKGTIVDVTYKDSTEGLPHTFVTYKVDRLLAGQSKTNEITLRFIGGKQQIGKVKRYLHVSDVPTFEKGESDVLFVRKNNTSICPLVNCSNGRFRDVNGLVTNEDGQPLLLTDKDEYKLSQLSLAAQLKATNRKAGSGRAQSGIEGESKIVLSKSDVMIDTESFVADLKQRLSLKKSNGTLKPGSFRSASKKKNFSTSLFRPTVAQETATKKITKNQMKNSSIKKSHFDLWEEEMIRKTGGDPVINNPDRSK